MLTKRLSSKTIRARSRIIGRGEQGEVREIRKNPFGKNRGEVVKIAHTTALYRPLTYFNTWLVEPREFDTKKRIMITQIVHNIANTLFPNNVVRIPLSRFPTKDPEHYYKKDLKSLGQDEVQPEFYMSKVEEPEELVDLKRRFYRKLDELQSRAEHTDFAGRQANMPEIIRLRTFFDKEIGTKYPQIYKREQKIEEAGLDIQHPEINFGFRNGHVVFYDLFPRLNIEKLLQYLQKPEVTEKQRKQVERLLNSLSRLNPSNRDLWDRRHTYFHSITPKGLEVLRRATGSSIEPKTIEEVHFMMEQPLLSDFYVTHQIDTNRLMEIIRATRMNGEYFLNGNRYMTRKLGDKILIHISLPEGMFHEMATNDVGLIALIVPIISVPTPRIDILNVTTKKIDLDFFIENNIVDSEQVRQLFL